MRYNLSVGRHSHGGCHHLVTLTTPAVQRLGHAFQRRWNFKSSGTQLRLLLWLRLLWLWLWLLRLLLLLLLLLRDHGYHGDVFGPRHIPRMRFDGPSDGLPVGCGLAATSGTWWWRQLVVGRARTDRRRSDVSPSRDQRRRQSRSGREERLKHNTKDTFKCERATYTRSCVFLIFFSTEN